MFLWSVPVALVGFLLALALKRYRCAAVRGRAAADMGDGFGMPRRESNERCLERAIGAIMSHANARSRSGIMQRSGTTLPTASAWGVIEVTRFARARGDAHIDEIARWHRLPTAVLDPTFDRLVGDGMIDRTDGILTLTQAGESEVSTLIAALRAWLREQLADWGAEPDDGEINRALDRIARRMLGDDADAERPALAMASGA